MTSSEPPAPPTLPRSRTDALIVGESLVDIVIRGSERSIHPGGSPMNVAYGLARLGVATTLMTSFGDDEYGELVARHLASAGVEVMRAAPARERTSSAIAHLDATGAASYEFDLRSDLPRIEPPAASVLHVGSIGAILEPGASVVRDLLERVGPRTVRTFDPNVRPAIMGAREAVRARVEHLVDHVQVVKLSDEDAAWLYPRRTIDAIGQEFLARGVKLFAVTLGDEGCRLQSESAAVAVRASPVDVVDTVGAGDTFMAALIYGLLAVLRVDGSEPSLDLDEGQLRTLARLATASAGVTVARAGAALPTLAELEAALARTDGSPGDGTRAPEASPLGTAATR